MSEDFYKMIGDIVSRLDILERFSGGSGGGGAVDSVNGYTGVVVLDPDDLNDTSTAHKFVTATDLTNLSNLSGTNSGDQVAGEFDHNSLASLQGGSAGQYYHLTSAQKTVVENTSGTNTGDQDLSALALKSNVLELDNTTPFTPDADYEPATKKYVDDNAGGSGSASYVTGEVPSGTVNSSNVTFTLANTPVAGTLQLYINGVRQKITEDYTISGATITMVTAPETGDLLLADYMVNAGSFDGSASFVNNETPTGTVDGSNVTFTLANTPVTGSLLLFRDGQLMKGGGADYTLTTNSIAFVTAPETGSVLLAFYQQDVASAGNADLLDGYHANSFLDPNITGWNLASEAWTYKDADEFYASGDVTGIYQKGDKIKFLQPTDGQKYMSIFTVGAYDSGNDRTPIRVSGGSDYDLDNEAITSPYFSKVENPQGFPDAFNYTPSVSASGSMTISSLSINTAKFRVTGIFFEIFLNLSFTTGGTASNTVIVSTPLNIQDNVGIGCVIVDATGGAPAVGGFCFSDNSAETLNFRRYDNANWSLGNSRGVRASGKIRY